MNNDRNSKMRFQKFKMSMSKFIYRNNLKITNGFIICGEVIILTLLFNLLYEWNKKSYNFYLLLLLYICCYYFWIRYSEHAKRKKILESIPQFLSLLIMTMGMGKSLRYAFEKVLGAQKGVTSDFYHEIFKKIFVLREQKSCFDVQNLDVFYENLFQISTKTSYQIQSLKNFYDQWLLEDKNQRQKQAIMLPVWIQMGVLCLLYALVQVWNVINGSFFIKDFGITAIWYGVGIYILFKQQSLADKRI